MHLNDPTNHDMANQKLLSHRLRGYAKAEHSRAAFQLLGEYNIPYIEIDTRVNKEGVIYLHHDPVYSDQTGQKHIISKSSTDEISQLDGSEQELVTLQEAVGLFSRYARADQKLCIDIKDIGFERHHLDIIRSSGLEQRVVFISWAPQVLVALSETGCTCPLILSCWHLRRLSVIGQLIAALFKNAAFKMGHYVILGVNQFNQKIPGREIGFQHSLIAYRFPAALTSLLRKSKGGICVHKSMLSPSLIANCQANKLQLWVFSAETTSQFLQLAQRDGVDIVFSDDAPATSKHLQSTSRA